MRDEKSFSWRDAGGILMLLVALGVLVVLAKPAVEEFFERAAIAVNHEVEFTAYRRLQ